MPGVLSDGDGALHRCAARHYGPGMIPNEYHFVFGLLPQREPFHLLHYLCLASCIAVNRPRRVVVHCLHQPWGPLWDRILPRIEVARVPPGRLELPKRHKDTFIARFAYAHLADFVRLEILLQHGGIYADMDTLFVRPLPPHLFECPCVMGLERLDSSAPAASVGGSMCNAFIMAEPGSAFIRLWLERMPAAFDGSWSAHSTFLPYALSREVPNSSMWNRKSPSSRSTGLRAASPRCSNTGWTCRPARVACIYGRICGGTGHARTCPDSARSG